MIFDHNLDMSTALKMDMYSTVNMVKVKSYWRSNIAII